MHIHNGARPIENIEDLRKYLTLVDYPASKYEIMDVVKKQGVNINIITLVQLLPRREYHTPKEVLWALGLDQIYGQI